MCTMTRIPKRYSVSSEAWTAQEGGNLTKIPVDLFKSFYVHLVKISSGGNNFRRSPVVARRPRP